MRILFINFNIGSTPGINNGIACLSAVLKEKGHETGLIFICEQLGYGLDLKRIEKDVVSFKPDIIGISLIETQLKYASALLSDLRRYYRGFVLCGGPYPTMDPEGCLGLDCVNAVCVGEGEDAIAELAEAIGSKKDHRDIKNIWVKSSTGIIKNKLRSFKDLDELPPEDKELFDLEKILPIKNYQLETMVGRGCIYQCSYCVNQSYLKKYQHLCERPVTVKDYVRMKDIDTAIAEIRDTVSIHPIIKKIAFIDDNFIMDEGYLSKFCEQYRKEIGLPFMCNANPVSYNRKKAKVLKDAGCDDVRFGIESGSERIKKCIMKRLISNNAVKKAFKINKDIGLMASSFNMIGLPTETKEEVLETLKLNAEIMPDTIKLMTFYPFKGTPIYNLCEELNLIDYDKKESLDNYDTYTCLNFAQEYQLYLEKMQTAFNWYINVFLDNESSHVYEKLVKEVEQMAEDEWRSFDLYNIDREASDKLKRKGIVHYKKHINRSLAIKSS